MLRIERYRWHWLLSIALLGLVLAGGRWWQAAEAGAWHGVGPIDSSWMRTPYAVEVNGRSIYLTFVGGRLTAFNWKDNHPKGCIVVWGVAERRYIDPCLGTNYDLDGAYIRGPSPRSLHRFPVRVTNNEVAVNTSSVIRGAPLNTPTLWERVRRWLENL